MLPLISRRVALVNICKPRKRNFLLFLRVDSHYAVWTGRFICEEAVYSSTDFILDFITSNDFGCIVYKRSSD